VSRPGHRRGLLYDLHASGCDGSEFAKCAPVVMDDPEDRGQKVEVVVMEWCGNCGAADWEVV
jgi:hypothetical protein